ncbi:serine hydrolase domain-containing protein [uncultured Prevotella sp.]|uniref:serine hydrolase domain-containing protein n=1 Tax=uncultured Prevotella sp. TaxID=159272 RepID=UPI002606AB7A|nr:serine hydrolase domain-containing protein [uncultured Prevotella sp.]
MARRKLRKKRIFILILIPCLIIAAVVAIFTRTAEEKQVAEKENVTSGIHLNDTLTNSMSDSPQLEDMENKIKRYLLRWEINGAQIAVTRNDSLLYVKGFGWADMEKKQEMQPSNIMRLASVSKLLTAVGVMRLAEVGTLKLSDHVFGPKGILNDTAFTNAIKDQRYLDITVEQLLRHKAGFTTGAGDPMFSTRYIMMQNRLTTPPDNNTLMKILLKRRLGFTPGTAKRYSNVGYTLLSMIIEKKTHMSYEDYMRRFVFEPAGCYDFHIAGSYEKDRRKNEVKYYMHKGSEPVYEYNNSGRMVEKCYGENDIPNLKGAGAWCASAAELSRLVASIDLLPGVKDILSKKSVEFMTREMPDHDFSIGWNFCPKGRPWIRTGSLSGTSALVLRYPDGECWILITNTSTWKGHGFSNDTMRLFERLRQENRDKFPKRNLFFS